MACEHELIHWITERLRIRNLKDSGAPRPWSDDPVFQSTYFCNVNREDDKVTKWIREYYSPLVNHPMFEYNIILSRFLNWPKTLEHVGYRIAHVPDTLERLLEVLAERGKVWGNAYVITTHGIPMGKAQYLARNVLEGAHRAFTAHQGNGAGPWHGGTLAHAHGFLMRLEGLGSFLSAQVLADLKNTPDHPLNTAEDWMTFVAPGPGSLRGASWFFYGEAGKVTPATFMPHFIKIRSFVNRTLPYAYRTICNQDLQNCLCEFDKYMRVKTGVGRSKRNYNGARDSA